MCIEKIRMNRLRLAKLNEQMKEDSDMGKTDDTFQEVFREFSNMASNNPELLRRNMIHIDQSEQSVPIEQKSEQSTKPEQSKQSTTLEQSKQSTPPEQSKQSTTPEQSKQPTKPEQSTTPEQSKQPTDGQSKQSTNITEQNPT